MSRIGPRYAECSLDSFDIYTERKAAAAQRVVIAKLRKMEADLPTVIEAGQNLAIFGPVGTGKDHMLAAMARKACLSGYPVEWVNGMDMFGEVRDRMDTTESEGRLLLKWTQPAVLAISDPIPPWGSLTEFQVQTLFRVVDRRYRDRKPVWITANFQDGAEAASKIGLQVIDRIKDGAIQVYCNWPSYRAVAE